MALDPMLPTNVKMTTTLKPTIRNDVRNDTDIKMTP